MTSIHELSDPYTNYLLPVLSAGPGVCPVCHTSVAGHFPRCWSCNSAEKDLASRADAIDFVALAVKNEQLAHELAYYKKASKFPGRARTESGLAAVLWRWLKIHESCVADRAGVDAFPIVTVIPSTKGRVDHPLFRIAGEQMGVTRDRFRPLLTANLEYPEDHDRDFSIDRFLLSGQIEEGAPVLIIDDTFTKGSRVQSAAALLKSSGSGPVGVACIGRHFDLGQTGEHGVAAKNYLSQSRTLGWDWRYCCLCDTRSF